MKRQEEGASCAGAEAAAAGESGERSAFLRRTLFSKMVVGAMFSLPSFPLRSFRTRFTADEDDAINLYRSFLPYRP